MNNVLKLLPTGTFMKNSCKPIEGFHYDHPLDGHGYINSFTITPQSIKYKGFRQQTVHYLNEKKSNKMLYRGIGTNSGNRFFVNNFNNVSIFVDESGNTFSCGEGGIPYHIDIEQDKTIGPVEMFNLPRFLSTNMPFLPLSAHPQIHDGTTYNFGCFNHGLYLTEEQHMKHLELFPDSYYSHDFKVTETYFVFFLNKMKLNLFDAYFGKSTILESLQSQPGSCILLINRETLESNYIEIGDNQHSYNAMHIPIVEEHDTNSLTLYACLSTHLNLQDAKTAYDFNGFNLHKIDLNVSNNTSSIQKLLDADAEMPVASKNGDLYMIDKNTLYKFQTRNLQYCGKLKFGTGIIIEEPCVVDDIVFVIGHNCEQNETYLFCINSSMQIIHREVFNFKIPYGFHGAFKKTRF
jgi:carotenoid cleavage dioxygenase-like enzyme